MVILVKVKSENDLVNQIMDVEIEDIKDFCLIGKDI